MNLLLDLNEQQAQAVRHGEGPILVIAGPGTGKTRVITYRIAHLIRQREIPPEHILAITFTNKAAQEMRSRVEALLGKTGLNVWIQTFHGACTQILRKHGDADDLNRHFVIFDQEVQEEILAECVRELGLDAKQYPLWLLRDQISYGKARLWHSQELAEHLPEGIEEPEVFHQLVDAYQEKLVQYDALDFDDLIIRTIQLLQHSDEKRSLYHQQIQYILVDEYQDINQAQYELLLQLANPDRNLMVVADADQAIYSWRGSDPAFIERFKTDFSPTVIHLATHYRSTQNILRTAQSLITQNRPDTDHLLDTRNELGTAIYHYRVADADEEAKTVTRLIQQLVERRRYSYGDIAVFYRTHRLADKLEEALIRDHIDVQRVHSSNSFHRERVREIVAYLRYFRWQLDRDLLLILNYPRRRLDGLNLVRFRSMARRADTSLQQAIRSLMPTQVGPLTRRVLHDFLDRLEPFLILRGTDREDPGTMDTVRQLLEFLDRERSIFPELPQVRRIRGLRLAADSLFRAIQLGETIHIAVQYRLEYALAVHILDPLFRAYLNVQPEIHWLQSAEELDAPLPIGTHVLIGDFPPVDTDIPAIRISSQEIQAEEHILLQDSNPAFVAMRLAQSLLRYFELSHFEGCTVCAFRILGNQPESAQIVEIAASRLDAAGRGIQYYHTRVRPRSGIPKGWSADEANAAPSIEDVLPDFMQFLDGQILVGHRISGLPVQVLERELRSRMDRGLGVEIYDTFTVAQRIYPRQNCGLESLAAKLNIQCNSLEDPLEAVAITQKIFHHLTRAEQEQQQLTTLEEMTPWVALATEEPETAYHQPAIRYCKQHGFHLEPILSKLREPEIEQLMERWERLQHEKIEPTPDDITWQQLKSEFLNTVVNFEHSGNDKKLESFLDYQSLITSGDEVRDRDKVTMMTLHSAKGTEFPVVIMIGMEEGSFPLYRSDEDLLQEERRLCYVGMTRAKERLYLISVRRREGDRARNPSIFIREIPKAYLRYWSPG